MASPDVQFRLFAQSIDPLPSFSERMHACTTLLDTYLEVNPPRVTAAGTCRHCGCQGDTCTLPSGDKCSWSDNSRTCCNAQGCLAREVKPKASATTKPLTRREARVPCDCISCSGRARGRCRRIYYRP